LDSLGKHLGPEDHRSIEQRQHDALAEALQRLIKAGLLPDSAGQSTMAQVIIPFGGLRQLPGSSLLEQEWLDARAGQPGWLIGPGADAEACDAAIAPLVVGSVDWRALDAMADTWIEAYGLDGHRRPCGCSCGGCTCQPPAPLTPEAKAQLRRALLTMAADAMSGPDGLAAYLRTRRLGVPYSGKPLPLDVGQVKGIPDHLRRAVILRDRHCAWPGGCDKPAAGCQVHHVIYRSRGGRTRLSDLVLLCSYHHQVCIHRLGWTLTLHPDGTTQARSPQGEILHSHGPPPARAG
jgi:HNH endonuclease